MVKTSRRPGNKAAGQCEAIAAKTCPFKHGQSHAQLALMSKTGSLSRDRQSSSFVRAWRSFLRPACAMVPSTNILMVRQHVSSVPYADSCTAATASLFDHLVGAGGMVRPIALAVLRLTRSQ
jgi:hypothetical protein